MKRNSTKIWIVLGIIVVIIIAWLVSARNGFIQKEEKVAQQWSEVQNTYQRRLNLIPNLVNVVKGVSDFEQSTLVQIVEERSKAAGTNISSEPTAENVQQQSAAQDSLAASANRVIAIIESYPDLKGTSAYTGLQAQLIGTEQRIKVARNDFNKAIADYNQQVRSFPSSLAARIFGFKPKEGFAASAGAENATEIKF